MKNPGSTEPAVQAKKDRPEVEGAALRPLAAESIPAVPPHSWMGSKNFMSIGPLGGRLENYCFQFGKAQSNMLLRAVGETLERLINAAKNTP